MAQVLATAAVLSLALCTDRADSYVPVATFLTAGTRRSRSSSATTPSRQSSCCLPSRTTVCVTPAAPSSWRGLSASVSAVVGGAVPPRREPDEGGAGGLFPRDPASTTPQLLASLWDLVAGGCKEMVRGDTRTVVFPNMQSEFNSPKYLNRLLGHFDSCKDVCDNFGINTVLVPYATKGPDGRDIIEGFTVKSYRNPDESDGEYKFQPDPFWDDDEEWDFKIEDDDAEVLKMKDEFPEIENRIPDDDGEITTITKTWVSKIMSDMGICPFTSGSDLAGLPMGNVFYTIDRSTSMEDMYARYWKEVVRIEQTPEREISTTLLICPEFCIDNVELFDSFSNTLTQPLEALGVEDLLQLVFFHPYWTFRDGSERSGLGSAANYARRSPWPMINILRTKQVRTAQKGIPTGLVYQQNEKTLNSIGTRKLETMLRKRNWDDIADVKVNRREMEALRVAQDLQSTGVTAEEDTSLLHDSTPAANKVDRRQVESGDMVNVLMQALEKRLEVGDGGAKKLSGAETSAALMASDFLLEELEKIAANSPSPPSTQQSAPPPQQSAYAAQFETSMFGDDSDESSVGSRDREDAEFDALFGGKGIMDSDTGSSAPSINLDW